MLEAIKLHRWNFLNDDVALILGEVAFFGDDVAFKLHEVALLYPVIYNGIRNVSPNGVFGNEVYGSDSKGFGVNPSSNEFRLCNSDEWRSGNHSGTVGIRGYGGGGDMVVCNGLKGCLDHWILKSSPILPPLQ
ncbi:hypothetical protein Tco_0278034 [Tanacetum coccineum]